jgi:hypothetical protein
MDGGGLVEKDDFLVARGRFLGIGTDSNGTPGQLHLDTMGLGARFPSLSTHLFGHRIDLAESAIDMEMHFRNAGFSNELVAKLKANIGQGCCGPCMGK